MTDTSDKGNADALTEETAGVNAPSLDDFITKTPEPKEKKPPKEEAEDPEDTEVEEEEVAGAEETESEESEQSEEEEESEEGEVLSQEIDIDELSPEDRVSYVDQLYKSLDDDARREWLSNQDGRVGKDMGKMRKAKAEAEQLAEAAEAKYQELQSKTFYAYNPFSTINDPEALDAKAKEVDANIAAARKFLRSDEDYFTLANGQEVDKATVDGYLDTFFTWKDAIPKQRDRIASIKKSKEAAKAAEEKLSETYAWLAEEDGPSYEKYKKLKSDPKWSMVADLIPELAEELPKVLAKYADAGDAATAKKKTEKLKLKGMRKPKGDLGGSSAGTRKRPNRAVEAKKRLFQGGASDSDVLAMFT